MTLRMEPQQWKPQVRIRKIFQMTHNMYCLLGVVSKSHASVSISPYQHEVLLRSLFSVYRTAKILSQIIHCELKVLKKKVYEISLFLLGNCTHAWFLFLRVKLRWCTKAALSALRCPLLQVHPCLSPSSPTPCSFPGVSLVLFSPLGYSAEFPS